VVKHTICPRAGRQIHCIGELEIGDLWEHLMLMIRCPFLALSATVNNPREFQAWLQAAKDDQRRQDANRGMLAPDGLYKVRKDQTAGSNVARTGMFCS
jgi:replicative superfamily II helicase